MKFTIGVSNITVSALGRVFVTNNAATHTVKLVQVSGQDVPGGAVQLSMLGGSGSFRYAPLASPVVLAAGSSYYLASQEANGSDRWYDIGAVTPTGDVTVNNSVYSSGSTWIIETAGGGYPTTNSSYVPVNLQYTLGGNTPTPSVIPIANCGPPPVSFPSYADPSTVLAVYEINTGPQPGTAGVDASLAVANHYMQCRGVSHRLGIATYIEDGTGKSCLPGGSTCDPAHSSSTSISYALYQSQIAAPILSFLKSPAGAKIKYIVTVYGVPLTTWTVAGSVYAGVDSLLSAILLPAPVPGQTGQRNPYWNSTAHIDADTSGFLVVSRLDCKTAVCAAGLVDKAIAGETMGAPGKGYFDWGPTVPLGQSTKNAYDLCVANPILKPNCVLNDQSATGQRIQSASSTAWALGGYDVAAINAAVYSFVPGAVGAQMNSLSGDCIRCPAPSIPNYGNVWLANGITATWAALYEPFTTGYTLGETLFARLWSGFTFGESCAIATPQINWMMDCFGDPLYRPKLL